MDIGDLVDVVINTAWIASDIADKKNDVPRSFTIDEKPSVGSKRQNFWYCKCGLRNTGRVCVDCGAKRQ